MGFSCTTSSNTRLTGWLAFRSKSVLPMPRMQKAREGAAEGTLDVEAGHAARELTDVLAAGVEHLQRLALQRADGTGHVADVLQAALGGHGDDGQLAGVWAGVWADAPTWIKANATAAAIGCRAAFFWGIAGLRWAMGSGRGFEQTGRSGRSGPK
jgi:hypothetical protein